MPLVARPGRDQSETTGLGDRIGSFGKRGGQSFGKGTPGGGNASRALRLELDRDPPEIERRWSPPLSDLEKPCSAEKVNRTRGGCGLVSSMGLAGAWGGGELPEPAGLPNRQRDTLRESGVAGDGVRSRDRSSGLVWSWPWWSGPLWSWMLVPTGMRNGASSRGVMVLFPPSDSCKVFPR
jgi:hypothetical protein